MAESSKSTKPLVLIAIISNTPTYPDYFTDSLINLHITTSKVARCHIRRFNACDINHMRNNACLFALGDNPEKLVYDYIVMLDQDHKYPSDFISRFIQFNKDIVLGSTYMRKSPFLPTQYKKIDCKPISVENNLVVPEGTDLIKIEASGVVGALIKTSVLRELDFPYFLFTYHPDKSVTGGDLYFSKQVKAKGFEMFLDPEISFPHEVRGFIDKGEITF